MPSVLPASRPPADRGAGARGRTGRLVVAAALGLSLAGCSTPAPAPPAPAPPVAAEPAAPSSTGPAAASPDAAVCADYRDRGSLLRETTDAIQEMPVLPAGVGLVLLGVRQTALTPGVQDPDLAAAQAELVAAIDDLDAQGRTLVGPDGDAARDAVRLDAARILRALTEVERLCGAPPT
jgi:hypothetical protein